jgi:cysteine synthase B
MPAQAGCCFAWCPGPDSNRHTLRRGILSPLRLPISPPGPVGNCNPAIGGEGLDYALAKAGVLSSLPQFASMNYPTLEDIIGATPLVRLQRLLGADARGNVILAKLEGNNPAGSVKDRPAISMIKRAEERGEIKPGDTLIEATSGNTGIALAMAAAIRGYRMVLIMPEDLSIERAQTMKAFGAELILTPKTGGMEYARDLAEQMAGEGKGRVLDQFANDDNPRVHYETTGPELWKDTDGQITHFVSAMGTTGTITGVSRFLKEKNPAVRIVGAQPAEGSRIPGIRKWPEAYLPKIYDPSGVDELVLVSQSDAEDMARRLAREEGLFAGISAAGACWVALQIARNVENATIAFIVCDRGDRYLSTGVFPA